MKGWIIGIALLVLIRWQGRRLAFWLLEYPTIYTDGVPINGQPWRKYVNSTHFTVGAGNLASDRVEEEIEKLLGSFQELYELSRNGPGKHETTDISSLIVLEAIERAEAKSGFMDKPVF